MAATRPGMTAARQKQALALHADGHGCNAIARQIGVSPAAVSAWAKRLGLPFDRRQTELAVRAHVIDLRLEALLAAQEGLVLARDLGKRVHGGDYVVHSFGGEDGEMRTGILEDAPAEVVRNAVVTMGIAIDKALKVSTSLDEGADLPAVDQWLAHMTGNA